MTAIIRHALDNGPTFRELLAQGTAELEQAGVGDAKNDAWYLLSEAFSVDRTHYYLEPDKPLRANRLTDSLPRYEEMLRRRSRRIPLQQILGRTDFMGLTFKVNEHVLIPRQDTEVLVETVLEECRGSDASVLDMCTGSGCIAISLAVRGKYKNVTGSDISREALKVAAQNGFSLFRAAKGRSGKTGTFLISPEGRTLSLLQSDLTRDLPTGALYDIITCNPPYIPTSVIDTLAPEVRDHDPRIALDGADDGLSFYRRLAVEMPLRLRRGGRVYLEIGFDEADAVRRLLTVAGFQQIRVIRDLAGLDRVVCAVYT